MKDVARLANVSQTTVSFVINDVPNANIPAETQERIMEAVRELGYRPNAVARNLRSQRTHTIGFVSDQIATTPFAGQMIQGAQDLARDYDKLILLVNTGSDKRMKRDAVETLLERQVDGIIYATMYHREVFPPETVYEVPTVLLDCYMGDRSLPSIVPDELTGGRVATEFLLQQGHRRIGLINNADPIPAARDRRQGYREALEHFSLSPDQTLEICGVSDQTGGYTAAMDLLQRTDRPSAIFCFNDRMAMGAYQAASDLGLTIPTDLAIIGFDNQETIAPFLRPPLTTMQLPHYEMGKWAAAHLIDLIANPKRLAGEPVQHKMACPLVERTSA
jgi:LacI family transcriptional regulator